MGAHCRQCIAEGWSGLGVPGDLAHGQAAKFADKTARRSTKMSCAKRVGKTDMAFSLARREKSVYEPIRFAFTAQEWPKSS